MCVPIYCSPVYLYVCFRFCYETRRDPKQTVHQLATFMMILCTRHRVSSSSNRSNRDLLISRMKQNEAFSSQIRLSRLELPLPNIKITSNISLSLWHTTTHIQAHSQIHGCAHTPANTKKLMMFYSFYCFQPLPFSIMNSWYYSGGRKTIHVLNVFCLQIVL